MQIIIPRNTFLEELFPGINDHKNLTEEDLVIIKEAYTNGGREPRIIVEEDHISIILEEGSQETNQDFDQLIALAEATKFDKALRLANRLISEYPAAADLHRIKGQILSEQGHPKKAIDALIEAARLDPDNESALIMLGNIYASDCSDADTAITFYERALQTNPDNYMAINNIGSNLANAGKYGDARRYFELAHELHPDYPNTLHGLALIAARQQNPREAFRYARKTFLKLDPGASAQLYRKNLALIKEEAQKYIAAGEGLQALVAPYKNELEQAGGKPITIE